MKTKKKIKKHWYFITTHACPVCGRENVYRERRYDNRPEKYEDRHSYDPMFYDYCDV